VMGYVVHGVALPYAKRHCVMLRVAAIGCDVAVNHIYGRAIARSPVTTDSCTFLGDRPDYRLSIFSEADV
jgi:hypothetical protein